jgi:hypothetical protein
VVRRSEQRTDLLRDQRRRRLDFEEWEELDLEAAAAPDDDEGAYDGSDDIDDDPSQDARRSDWAEPLRVRLRVRRINGDEWPDSDADDNPAPRSRYPKQ